ncbi:hypothetical protein [Cryobacterium sp. M91]|uniref:hypothetical protein n=1 Tax=Cryobacterium sp. M91 TaxID=2048294 RepID=UPI000CE42A91|nr:hypothetical protein [Cryobacterium sp. M91]
MKRLIAPIALAIALALTGCAGTDTTPTGAADSKPVEEAPQAPDLAGGQVESLPFNASGLLGGTAQPTFPDGEPGEVSVVQVGPLDKDSGTLIFAFRNNTSDGISHVDWSSTARSGGSIVATGSSQGTTPSQVQPGEVGLAYIYFDNSAAVPDDSEYEFTASTSPVDTSSYNTAPFKVTEANLVGEAIVGSAINETGAEATGPYSVSIYCFDGDNLLSQSGTYAEQDDDIADGGTVTFSANLYGDACPTFALGVGGYFS